MRATIEAVVAGMEAIGLVVEVRDSANPIHRFTGGNGSIPVQADPEGFVDVAFLMEDMRQRLGDGADLANALWEWLHNHNFLHD